MSYRKIIGEIDSNVLREIERRIMHGITSFEQGLDFALVYAAFIAQENNIADVAELLVFIEENISERRAMFVKGATQDNIQVALELASSFSKNDLLSYMLVFPRELSGRRTAEYGTPESISKLALKVLDIKENESVADFGSGNGDFITLASKNYEKNSIFGVEINTYYCEISKIRAELFADNVEVKQADMFEIPSDKKFEKIFSNYPFGRRLIDIWRESDYFMELSKRMPEINKTTSSDWIFNALLLDHIADDGKAVAIMTNGGTWNSIDQKIREYFIKNGFVEAVISLPARIFDFTAISTTMIVLSKNNTEVRMVDATNLCTQGRRQTIITDEDIERIVFLLKDEGDEAYTVDFNTFKQNEFVLNPLRYLEKEIEIEDGVEFDSLIKRITRGAPLRASALDEMVSEEPTDIQYLMLSNIQNGMISEDLPYLKEIDPRHDRYCIGNRNLLFSKNGAPFKVAVAEVEEGKKILGSGNLFIIELDEKKVNPYFIKAFFDSEVGAAVLKKSVVGATMPMISLEALKKLIVPCPSIEKQNEIANKYQAKQDEIKVLQQRIQKAQNDLKSIFGEVD